MSETASLIEPRRRRIWLGLALSSVGGLLCWAAWMGWDVHYDTDSMTGEVSGPYEQWQVIGSAVSLLVWVIAVGLSMKVEVAFGAYALITVAYTLGFCVTAIVQDNLNPDMGADLWPLGALFLLVGAGTGIFVVGAIVGLLRYAVARRAGRRRLAGTSW